MATTRRVTRRTERAHRASAAFRILLATSGDSTSRGAIRLTASLARLRRAEVEVLTVATPFPHSAPTAFEVAPPPIVDADSRARALELAREQLAGVRGTAAWQLRAATGWPSDAITSAADRWDASLVVVGLGEHGLLARLFGSETAVHVARRTTVPVLAVPEHVERLPSRAIAAVDFTESSIDAARTAARLLATNGTLTLVHVSMLIKAAPDAGSLSDVYTAGAHTKLDAIRDRLSRETRRQVAAEVVEGDVTGGLLDFAERHDCDLIALGSHEQGLIDRLVIGSVRQHVIRDAHVPILISPASNV